MSKYTEETLDKLLKILLERSYFDSAVPTDPNGCCQQRDYGSIT